MPLAFNAGAANALFLAALKGAAAVMVGLYAGAAAVILLCALAVGCARWWKARRG